jgi:tRNA (guanosine-2'-O-)-methyltransferase
MNTVASFAFTRTTSIAARHQISRTGARLTNIGDGANRYPKLFSSSISDNDTTSLESNNESQPKQKRKSTRKSRNRVRREEQERLGESQTELNWETFDFSLNPKQDHRFSDDGASIAANKGLDVEEEALEDKRHSQKLKESNNAYLKLDPELVARAIAALEPWINDDRLARVSGVLKQRTKHSKFLFENPSNPSNVWACLRTIDSFGMQNVDVIIDSGRYAGKQAISQKKGMRTAMGSAQWLTLTNHHTTEEAIEEIRSQGFKIYASDLNPNSKDVRDIDWDADDRPICIVMGNEDRGISQEMRELADETFTLPMSGFAESFNLSVATSITLAHMSAKSYNCEKDPDGKRRGPLRPGDLSEHEYNCLYLKGLLHSLPQKRMSKALLKQAGVELPDALKEL